MDATVDARGPRERAYDELISPLMGQIIKICKEHGVPIVASFELDMNPESAAEDDPLCCSTVIVDPEPGKMHTRSRRILEASKIIRPERPFAFAETITTTPDGTKHVKIQRIS